MVTPLQTFFPPFTRRLMFMTAQAFTDDTLPISQPPMPLEPGAEADAAAGHYDEFRGAPAGSASVPSADWQCFLSSLPDTSPQAFNRHQARLQRLMHDNGISYTAPGGQTDPSLRPWELNLFPLLIPHAEWQHLAQGIQQRMHLLEHILADVYGPQVLLRQGLLPPALVQGHPGYLRPMHGILQQRYLHIAAFDLIRDGGGQWWLMAQRTQAPSGLGYLIENRHVSRQLFPDGFNQLLTAAISESYRLLLQDLRQRCKHLADAHEPLTLVLLTPGADSETWFEHAYLARYLGLPLVQGGDLTVRNARLYLKTLQGLVRVHGVLRRVDDSWMDALELRPESRLGVPGLLQVMRDRQVIVANSPGSSFLESPALQGFMPPLARHILQEPLLIPALPTWWCGEAAAWENVQSSLGQMAIKPTYSGSELHDSFPAQLGRQLNAEQLASLQQDIAAQGDDFTVQQYLPPSRMPCWTQNDTRPEGHMALRSLVLRLFALSDGDSWRVLPGGIARPAAENDGVTSMQTGGSSADVWITGWKAPETASPPSETTTPAATTPLVSRIAENLFWLGRYTERTENAVRLQLLALDSLRQLDRPGSALLGWLQQVLHDQQLLPMPLAPDSARTADSLAQELNRQWQAGNNMAQANVDALARTAAELRSQLPHQHWHLVQIVQRRAPFKPTGNRLADAPAMDISSRILRLSHALAAVTGVQLDRLQRDHGWHMLMLGRWIERLSFVAGTLLPASTPDTLRDSQTHTAIVALFDPFLQQSRLHSQDLPAPQAWHTLATSQQHPRSLTWVLQQISLSLQALPPQPFSPQAAEGHADDGSTQIEHLLADLQASAAAPSATTLQQCVQLAISLTDGITRRHFNPVDHASHSVGA